MLKAVSEEGVGGGGSPAFSAITSGTNTTAAMVVGSGASLTPTGTGTITATTTETINGLLAQGTNITITGSGTSSSPYTITSSSTASTAFSALTGSTNTTAAMVVGTGASIAASGSGSITATAVPASGITGTLGVTHGGTGTATAFTQGSVIFAGASGVYSQDNSYIFWDDTNHRLCIGANTPISWGEGTTHYGTLSVTGSIAGASSAGEHFLQNSMVYGSDVNGVNVLSIQHTQSDGCSAMRFLDNNYSSTNNTEQGAVGYANGGTFNQATSPYVGAVYLASSNLFGQSPYTATTCIPVVLGQFGAPTSQSSSYYNQLLIDANGDLQIQAGPYTATVNVMKLPQSGICTIGPVSSSSTNLLNVVDPQTIANSGYQAKGYTYGGIRYTRVNVGAAWLGITVNSAVTYGIACTDQANFAIGVGLTGTAGDVSTATHVANFNTTNSQVFSNFTIGNTTDYPSDTVYQLVVGGYQSAYRVRESVHGDLFWQSTNWNLSNATQDDTSLSSWMTYMGAGNTNQDDYFKVSRVAAGTTTVTNLLALSNTGSLTLPSGGITVGTIGTAQQVHVAMTTLPFNFRELAMGDKIGLMTNLDGATGSPVNTAQPSWVISQGYGSTASAGPYIQDRWQLLRAPANTGYLSAVELLGVGSTGITTMSAYGAGVATFSSAGVISSTSTTGSGNVVLSNSPTLVTPALGTPSALVGTNITGTAAALTVGTANVAPASGLTGTTLASNVVTSSLTTVGTIGTGTWQGAVVGTQYGGTGQNLSSSTGALSISGGTVSAGTLPVSDGGTGVTTSTGSGNVVLSNSPTLVTPALGTPASGNLSNCTGIPVAVPVAGAVGSMILAGVDSNVAMGGTIGGSSLTPSIFTSSTSLLFTTGDSLSGTWQALQTVNTGSGTTARTAFFQRTA